MSQTPSSFYVTFCFCIVIVSSASGWYGNNTIVTECETPDNKTGFCIEVRQCKVLFKQWKNKRERPFLYAYRCGPTNENTSNPKMCCAKNMFQKMPRNKAKYNNIFPKSCGRQKVIFERRIIGGKEASLGEYPWMARLIHKNSYGYKSSGCSGFLVHPRFVITAAHCTHPFYTSIRGPVAVVELGEHDTETEIDCSDQRQFCAEPKQVLEVARIITHKRYNPQKIGHYNDIAIIYLKEKARLTNFVQPICIIKKKAESPARYYLSGWGTTKEEMFSKVKMKVEVPPFDKKRCKEKYSQNKIYLKNNQICAGGEDQRDSCTGDSGGPLMTSTDDGIWYASGIVSFGLDCGKSGWPAIYTNVTKFLPWIKMVMQQMMRNSLRKNNRYNNKSGNEIHGAQLQNTNRKTYFRNIVSN